MFKRTRISAAAVLAVGGLAIGATSAMAQQTLERVTITGSNIKRVEAESPTSVQVIKAQDIEKSGATTLNEVFLKLPGFSSFNDETDVTGAPSRATLGFRNFDATNVLVLVNGRRLSRNAVNGSSYDLNSIPSSAIERIEILKDGAAAIYGSDAVAGVVNFIMRRNFTGVEAAATYGEAPKTPDGRERRVSVAVGKGDLDADGYNILLTGDWFKRSIIFRRDRDVTFRKVNGQFNEAAPTGNIRTSQTGGLYEALNPCPEAPVSDNLGTNYCPYYFNQSINLVPATQRGGLFGSFTKRFSANLDFFAEYMYSHVYTFNSFSAPPGSFRTRTPAGFTITIPAGGITTQNNTSIPAGTYPGDLRIRYDQNGVRRFIPISDATRLVTGLEGRSGELDWTVDLGRSKTRTSELSTGFFDYATANADFTAGTFDPFKPPVTSELSKYNVNGTTKTATHLTFLNFKVSRSLWEMSGGPAAFAAGVSRSKEDLTIDPDEISESGRVSATGTPVVAMEADRSLTSAFAELSLPVVKGLETQLAARFDKYSDVGSVATPKLAAKFQLAPQLAIRGSYARGFVAPDLENMYKPGEQESAEFVRDNAVCRDRNIATCNADQVDTFIISNKDLKPEKSTTLALGFVAAPLDDLLVQADWFRIAKRNRVDTSLQYLVDNPDAIVAGKKASEYIVRANPAAGFNVGTIDFATVPYQNVASEVSSGIQLGTTYRMNGLGGKVTLDNQLAYYSKYQKAQAPGESLVEYIGTIDNPRYKNVFSVNLDTSGWTATAIARTLGPVMDATEPTEVTSDTSRVPSWTTYDFQIAWKGVALAKDRFTIGMKNALNKAPTGTEFDNAAGYPNNQNAVGRFTYVSYSVAF